MADSGSYLGTPASCHVLALYHCLVSRSTLQLMLHTPYIAHDIYRCTKWISHCDIADSPNPALIVSLVAYTCIMILPAIFVVNAPPTKSVGARYVGATLFRAFCFQLPIRWVGQVLSFIFACSLMILHIQDALLPPRLRSFSKIFLVLHGLVLAALGLLGLSRPWMPYRISRKGAAWKNVYWFSEYASVSVMFIVLASGYGVCLNISLLT